MLCDFVKPQEQLTVLFYMYGPPALTRHDISECAVHHLAAICVTRGLDHMTDVRFLTEAAIIYTLPCPNVEPWHWAMGRTIGVLGFDSWRGLGIFLFTTVSRTALGPTQPPIQRVSGALSLGVKRPGREADHSPPLPIRLHGVALS
jgi:hypothetical protein